MNASPRSIRERPPLPGRRPRHSTAPAPVRTVAPPGWKSTAPALLCSGEVR